MSAINWKSPKVIHTIIALALSLTLFFLFNQKINGILSWILSVNIVTFVYYGFDKMMAVKVWLRVPEIVLHWLAFAGGSPAAFLAQKTFSHKTVKSSFRTVYWVIVAIQAALLVWYLIQWARG